MKDTRYQQVLENGDIGVIRVEKKIVVQQTFPGYLKLYSRNRVMHKLCSPHGYLKGIYVMLADILKIDMENNNKLHELTIARARQKYNQLGGKSFCRCKHNFVLNKKECSCIALGILCRDKGHGTKKGCNPIHCSNCTTPGTLPHAAPTDNENLMRETVL